MKEVTQHTEDCNWVERGIQKTENWYKFMAIKLCPGCGAAVEFSDK